MTQTHTRTAHNAFTNFSFTVRCHRLLTMRGILHSVHIAHKIFEIDFCRLFFRLYSLGNDNKFRAPEFSLDGLVMGNQASSLLIIFNNNKQYARYAAAD